MKKRLLSLFLALIMVLGMLPATALAAEGDVATFNGTGYTTVQAAVDEAVKVGGSVTVEIIADTNEKVTIPEAKDLHLTLKSTSDYTFSGKILIKGNSSYENGSTTIQGITFDAKDLTGAAGDDACIYVPYTQEANSEYNLYRYSQNVTVSGCTFKDSGNNQNAVAMKQATGGCKNWTVIGCTVESSMHSLLQLHGVDGVKVDNCKVYSKNGINLASSDNIEVKGSSFDVSGYCIRTGDKSGGLANAETISVSSTTLKTSATDEGAIVIRGSGDNAEITLSGVTVEAAIDIQATDAAKGANATINGAYESADGEWTVGEEPDAPTATVGVIPEDKLTSAPEMTFALNFKADEISGYDRDTYYYSDWYADFELTVNKNVTFHADDITSPSGDQSYLAGEYGDWGWYSVPYGNDSVTATNEAPVKIMETAASLLGQSGLELRFWEVYEGVAEFNCGVYFTPTDLEDLEVTLSLCIYHPTTGRKIVIGTYKFPGSCEITEMPGTGPYFVGDTFEVTAKVDPVAEIEMEVTGGIKDAVELIDTTKNVNGSYTFTYEVKQITGGGGDITFNATASNGGKDSEAIDWMNLRNKLNVSVVGADGSSMDNEAASVVLNYAYDFNGDGNPDHVKALTKTADGWETPDWDLNATNDYDSVTVTLDDGRKATVTTDKDGNSIQNVISEGKTNPIEVEVVFDCLKITNIGINGYYHVGDEFTVTAKLYSENDTTGRVISMTSDQENYVEQTDAVDNGDGSYTFAYKVKKIHYNGVSINFTASVGDMTATSGTWLNLRNMLQVVLTDNKKEIASSDVDSVVIHNKWNSGDVALEYVNGVWQTKVDALRADGGFDYITITLKDGRTATVSTTADGKNLEDAIAAGEENPIKVAYDFPDIVPPEVVSLKLRDDGKHFVLVVNEPVVITAGNWYKDDKPGDGTKWIGKYSEDKETTVTITDLAGNSTIVPIDHKKPVAAVTYSTTDPTNQKVTVTLTFDENVTVTTDGWTKKSDTVWTKVYETNGVETVEFKDTIGNKNTAEVSVANIDKDAPKVSYVINGNQVIISANEVIQQPANGWSKVENKYTELGTKWKISVTRGTSKNLTIKDLAGNETPLTIDLEAPVATVAYSTTEPTNQDVVATITFDELAKITSEGWTATDADANGFATKWTKTYSENTSEPETVTFVDAVKNDGNQGTAEVSVANIDKDAPKVSYVINGNQVIVSADEVIQSPAKGWSKVTNKYTELGTKWKISVTRGTSKNLIIKDLAGNETPLTIDLEAPVPTVSYVPTEITEGSVVVTISFDELTKITSDGWTATEADADGFAIKWTKTYTANTTETVEFVDAVKNDGNKGSVEVKVDNIRIPLNVTINGNTRTVTYNGKEQNVKAVLPDAATLPAEVTIAFKDGVVPSVAGSRAGTYTRELTEDMFTVDGGGKYSVYLKFEGELKLVIEPKDIKDAVVSGIDPVTYNGQEQKPTDFDVTVKLGYNWDEDTVLSSTTDYDVSYSNNINAGTAIVTITGKGNFTGTVTKEFTINRADITVEYEGDLTKVYDGEKFVVDTNKLVIKSKETGEEVGSFDASKVTYEFRQNNVAVDAINAGEYKLYFIISGNGIVESSQNYNGAVPIFDAEIKRADIIVEYADLTKVYDGEKFAVDTSKLVIKNKETNKEVPFDSSKITYEFRQNNTKVDAINAGEYKLYFIISGNGIVESSQNYNGAVPIFDAEIKRADIIVEYTDLTKVYDGEKFAVDTSKLVIKSKETGEEVESFDASKITYEFRQNNVAVDAINAGEYKLYFIISGNGIVESSQNYNGAVPIFDAEIKKADPVMTLVVSDVVYDGNGHPATYEVKGADGKDVTGTVASAYYLVAEDGSETRVCYILNGEVTDGAYPVNVGTYNVTLHYVGDDNHNKKTVEDSFTISPATITDKDVAIDPEEVEWTGNAQTVDVTVTWNGKALEAGKDYTVAYANNTDVSTADKMATVTITGKGNYTGEVTKTFKIIVATYTGSFVVNVTTNGTSPLKGAKFGLYKDAACTDLFMTATTGTDGVATFELVNVAIEPNSTATYYLKQISAPDDYRKDSNTYTVVLTPDGESFTTEITKMTTARTFALAATAAAAETGGSIDIVNPPVSSGSSASSSTTVTFVAGDEYALEAQKGTSTKTDGSVVVTLSGSKLAETKIPDVIPADAYYEFVDWAVEDKDGDLVAIDLESYKFTKNTKVYAIMEDVWTPYVDMKQDRSDWYYQYARDLSIAGVVNGVPGGAFAPVDEVTWGVALKLIMLAVGYEEQAPVDAHWASGYLAAALRDGLVTAEQNIDLNATLTRLEYAQVAYKAMGLKKVNIASPFADTADEAVLVLYKAGIFEGTINAAGVRLYNPDNNITRAEISTVIWRINKYED